MAKMRIVTIRKQDITVATAGTAIPVIDVATGTDPLIPFRFTPDFVVYNNNASNAIYVGDSTVDNDWIPIASGSSMKFVHGHGSLEGRDVQTCFDLGDIYIDCTADGDTAIVEFVSIKQVEV